MTAGHRVLCSLLIASLTLAAGPVVAQDQGLDQLIDAGAVRAGEISGVDAHGVLLYRLPFAFHLRSLDAHPWGLRVNVPLSLSALKMEGASDVGDFVKKLGFIALVPGIEVELPVGDGSFATAPAFRVWRIALPWIALGYQFGEVVSGVRIYTTFPF